MIPDDAAFGGAQTKSKQHNLGLTDCSQRETIADLRNVEIAALVDLLVANTRQCETETSHPAYSRPMQ